ncbi:MAG: GIY-YIG nuclease family protein [Patescibacteria group bacterium]|nr:GIY-YIG nuclease family protein [Patescibacteria group bacterium]
MRREYQFFVYLLTNYRKTVLYTGMTNNLVRRMIEHKFGFGCAFTRKYKTKYLVYYEPHGYFNRAVEREKELKGWCKNKKINLIKRDNPLLLDLSDKIIRESGYSNETIKNLAEEIRASYKIDPSRGAQDDKTRRVSLCNKAF